MWTDSHAHLAELDEVGLTRVLAACRTENVAMVLNTATDLKSSHTVISQARSHPELVAAVGVSPFDAPTMTDDGLAELERLLDTPRVVAVGEIGLDTSNPAYPSADIQRPVFERLLDLARSRKLPAVVHSRGSESTVAQICASHGPADVVFHCFTGDMASLKLILDRGYSVSFSGIITFKNHPLIEAVAYTPLDRMLIETDSPYLTPHPYRGSPNQPSYVPFVGKRIAEIKRIDSELVARTTQTNFARIFGSSPPGN